MLPKQSQAPQEDESAGAVDDHDDICHKSRKGGSSDSEEELITLVFRTKMLETKLHLVDSKVIDIGHCFKHFGSLW